MTRKEEIEEAARKCTKDNPMCNNYEYIAFIRGAEYADRTMIDRACNWLCMNMTSIEYLGLNGNISKPNFIRRFKQAMKGEKP